MSRDPSLWRLASGFIALEIIAGLAAPVEIQTPLGLTHLPIVPLFVLTFTAIVLLALWLVLSPSAIWSRLFGSIMGLACLEVLFDLALKGEFLLMPCLSTGIISLSLLAARGLGVRLHGPGDPTGAIPARSPRIQFSIRGLMILTVVVALLSTAVRSLKGTPGPFSLGLMVIFSLCVVGVGLLTILAILGRGCTVVWGLAIFAISPLLGVCFAYAASAHHDGWVYIIVIMLLYPAILFGSLAFVRSRGFRLIWVSVMEIADRGGSQESP